DTGMNDDQKRALSLLEGWKNDLTKNGGQTFGNDESAIRALIGSFNDLQTSVTTVQTANGTIFDQNTQLAADKTQMNELRSQISEIAQKIDSSTDHATLLSDLEKIK